MFFSIFFKSLNLTMSTLLHFSLLCQCCAWALMIQAACRNLSWAALLSELCSFEWTVQLSGIHSFMTLTGEWRIHGSEVSSWGNARQSQVTSKFHTDQWTQILSAHHAHKKGLLTVHVPAHPRHNMLTQRQINHLDCKCTNDSVDVNEKGDTLVKATNDARRGDITPVPL